jgi:hypothetical protein
MKENGGRRKSNKGIFKRPLCQDEDQPTLMGAEII